MRMSTRGRFGLRSLLHLASLSANRPIPVSELAEEMDVSADYLMQLFVKLRRNGLLKSVRGPRGGFKFARPVDKITVGDVIRSVEGSISPVFCVEEVSRGKVNEKASAALCKLAPTCLSRPFWVHVTKELIKLFDSTTLTDIIKTGGKSP